MLFVASGVSIGLVSLLFNTLYVFRNNTGETNLLTYLHEKYTPGIERFFLFLLVPTAILKMVASPGVFVGAIIFVVVIYGAGLQFYALVWRILEKNRSKRNLVILSAIILSFTSFSLVFLGDLLPVSVRLILIMIFSFITTWLMYSIDTPKNIFILWVVFIVPVLFSASTLIRFHVIPGSLAPIIFNVGVPIVLTAGIFRQQKTRSNQSIFDSFSGIVSGGVYCRHALAYVFSLDWPVKCRVIVQMKLTQAICFKEALRRNVILVDGNPCSK